MLIKAKETTEKLDIRLDPLLVRDLMEWSKRLDLCLKDININIFVQGRGLTLDPLYKLEEIKEALHMFEGIREAVPLNLKDSN